MLAVRPSPDGLAGVEEGQGEAAAPVRVYAAKRPVCPAVELGGIAQKRGHGYAVEHRCIEPSVMRRRGGGNGQSRGEGGAVGDGDEAAPGKRQGGAVEREADPEGSVRDDRTQNGLEVAQARGMSRASQGVRSAPREKGDARRCRLAPPRRC